MEVCDSSIIAHDKELQCGVLSLATETLLDIVSYLTAYERLCLRITCKRFYSILSDPRAWHTLVWRDCRKRGSDYKALRLALKLSASTVQSISILYPRYQSIAKFLSQVHSCRQVRYLTLSGKLPSDATLIKLFSQLPLLFFSVTVEEEKDFKSIFPLVHAKAKDLKILRIVTVDDCLCYFCIRDWKACGYFPPNLQVCYPTVSYGWSLHSFLDKLSKSDHPAKLAFYPKCSSAAGNLVNKYPLVEIALYPNVQVASVLFCQPLKS